ncbi:MAG: PqqD family protein [Prevotella sp.]|nr:PqqD family protein [Prevotella sp.]
MRQKKGFVLRDVCGEMVIVGEGLGAVDFGKLISLNETAAFLWQQAEAQGDFTVDSLTAALCREYDVEEDRAHGDVERIVAEWQKVGVVE